MKIKIKDDLGNIQRTHFIPVLAGAVETQKNK
jgi:hypothetical protein